MTLKVSKIKIENILGIEELEFSPGKVTVIDGRNGSGKTSAIEAVKAALSGGQDATLLRKGASHGEAVLVLSDGRSISRKLNASGQSSFLMTTADGGALNAPQTRIKSLLEGSGINPLTFLSGSNRDRMEMIGCLIKDLDSSRLAEFGYSAPTALAPLDALDFVHKSIFDERTSVNRLHKEKTATAKQLREGLPVAPSEPPPSLDQLEEKAALAESAAAAEVQRIESKREALIEVEQAKIDQAQAVIDEARSAIAEIKHRSSVALEKAGSAKREALAELSMARKHVAEQIEAKAKAEALLQSIEQMESEAETHRKESELLTGKLSDLDRYKKELLSSINIEGIEIKDGELMVDGVPFERLNTSRQMDIAVEVAKRTAGALKLICVDGCEAMDSATFADFTKRFEGGDYQLICTRVTDGDLTINTNNNEEF